MAYLEQSTRYVPYTDRPGGHWKYHVPKELAGTPLLARYRSTLDRTFEIYARWIEPMQEHFRERFPKEPSDSDGVYRAAIRAKALDTLRGLLPAAVQSNIGLFGTGQAYEALLLRMRANPLAESQDYAGMILTELRKVIPAFLTRVDQPDRGGAWTQYLASTGVATAYASQTNCSPMSGARPRAEVTLTDFDPDGEIKVVAAALYAVSDLPDDQLFAIARRMSADDRATSSSRLRRRPGEPPSQAGPRVRAHDVSVRCARGLRRVPRSSAPSPADTRVAAARRAPRLRRAGCDRGRRRAPRLDGGDGRLGRAVTTLCMRPGCRPWRRTPSPWRIASGSTWT